MIHIVIFILDLALAIHWIWLDDWCHIGDRICLHWPPYFVVLGSCNSLLLCFVMSVSHFVLLCLIYTINMLVNLRQDFRIRLWMFYITFHVNCLQRICHHHDRISLNDLFNCFLSVLAQRILTLPWYIILPPLFCSFPVLCSTFYDICLVRLEVNKNLWKSDVDPNDYDGNWTWI